MCIQLSSKGDPLAYQNLTLRRHCFRARQVLQLLAGFYNMRKGLKFVFYTLI